MINLDLKTILTIIVIANFFVITFFVIYLSQYRSHAKKLTLYITARVLQNICWLAYAMNFRKLDPQTMAVTMVALAFGTAIESYCLITANNGYVKKKLIGFLALAALLSVIYAVVATNLKARVFVASAFLGLFYIFIWIDLALLKNRTLLKRVTGWLGFAIALLFYCRAFYPIVSKNDLIIYNQTSVNVLTGLSIVVLAITFPLIILLLKKEFDEMTILDNQKELLKKNLELRKINTTKDRFFSIISHDLIAPYNSMLGLIEIAETEASEKNFANTSHYLSIVRNSAQNNYLLIENLLHWSRIQLKSPVVNKSSFVLNELIEEVVDLFKTALDQKRLKLKIDLAKEHTIFADRFMIHTVMRNLLSNAIKFTPRNGFIEIGVSIKENYSLLIVKDSGVGIKQEDLEHLLTKEDFYTTMGTENEKGTGLGLKLCHNFVKLNHGRIWAESSLGKGTTFYISLPTS